MKFKQGQRFRVIVGSACFYATAKQIRDGVGDFVRCNQAVREAMRALQDTRSNDDVMACATGLAATYEGLQVQINMA
jgi:hypothetical protein